MEKVIKVVVADDHQMIIDGIKAFFIENENIHLLDSANSGEELFRILADKKVDIVITDINMPGMDGIEITRNIKKQYPNIKVIALSMYIDKNLITEMISAGANGYVLKNTGKQDLIDAITTVHKGEKYYSSDVALKMMDAKTSGESIYEYNRNADLDVNLTKREIEILKLISQEYTTPQIAEKLFISTYTVDTHRKNLIAKLDVKNVAGLVKYAVQNGLVQ